MQLDCLGGGGGRVFSIFSHFLDSFRAISLYFLFIFSFYTKEWCISAAFKIVKCADSARGAYIFDFISKPSGLRYPVFAARGGARLQKADRVPLALSQFSRRAAERPCENWSAAPAAASCFVHWTRSPPLPLLRLAASSAGRASAAQPAALSGTPCGLRRRPQRGLGCRGLLLLGEGAVKSLEPLSRGGPAGPGLHIKGGGWV